MNYLKDGRSMCQREEIVIVATEQGIGDENRSNFLDILSPGGRDSAPALGIITGCRGDEEYFENLKRNQIGNSACKKT